MLAGFYCNGKEWFQDGDFPEGADDPGFRELYVRWMQYGTLLPILRPHGTGVSRELWNVCPPGSRWYEALVDTVRLRYRFLPYLYTLLSETNRHGVPMMRHPALVFPADRSLRTVDDQLMLGGSLLAKPVTWPMYHLPGGEAIAAPDESVTVYLPTGHQWYDFENDSCYHGGQSITIPAALEKIPIFLRSGAILPLGPVLEYTGQHSDEPLEIRVYPGEDGYFVLYEDEGDGYAYEKGVFSLVPFIWDDCAKTLTIGQRSGMWPGMPESRTFRVRVTGLGAVDCIYTGAVQVLRY